MPDQPKDPFLAGVPERVHLEKIEEPRAGDPDPALEALRASGFADCGRYRVREVAGALLEALVHEGERTLAVLTHHPRAGTWLTLGCRYVGEGGLRRVSYTNATSPLIGVLDVPPDAVNVKMAGASAAELFARLRAERPAGTLEPVTPDTFAAAYERAYAEEMDWRLRKGVSLAEVARVAEARNEKTGSNERTGTETGTGTGTGAGTGADTGTAADDGSPFAQLASLLHQVRLPDGLKTGPPPNLTAPAIAGNTELVRAFLATGADGGEPPVGAGSRLRAHARAGRR